MSPVDDYQGLRVLEAGLEAGQKVIVEGIQLVRTQAGQARRLCHSKSSSIPPRRRHVQRRPPFTARSPGLPGMDSGEPKATPAVKKSIPPEQGVEPASQKPPGYQRPSPQPILPPNRPRKQAR